MVAKLLAELRQPVGTNCLTARLDVDAEEAGRVEAENLVLDLVGELRILVALHELVRHSQATQALDLTLRTAAPDRIGPPEDVIRSRALDHLTQEVQAAHGVRRRE